MFAKSSPGETATIQIGNGIDVEPGWFPLLDRVLADLGEEVRLMTEDQRARFAIAQIKEKYGELTIYTHGGNDLTAAIIEEAEALSRTICEQCGAPGSQVVFAGKWYATLCAPCAQKDASERNATVVSAAEFEGT
jgi:hypothetical protein